MRIIYGVSGEGLGHVYEAREIAGLLRREGHAVKLLTYGDRACAALAEFHPLRIEGLPLHCDEGGLSLRRTMVENLHVLPFYARHWGRLRRELEAFEPDAFLTAYEPYTTLMAHVLRRPLISMDNQNALRYLRRAPPGSRVGLALVRLATWACTWGAARYLIKSYRPMAARSPRDRIVPPLVQREIRDLLPANGEHVLIYLTKPNEPLLETLRAMDVPGVVYCGERTGVDGRLRYRPRGAGFLEDLAGCRAIIGTAGFSLIADALYLGKPYFAVPLRKQFEQTSNALFLGETGCGAWSENPTRAELEQFLADLPRYRERLAAQRFDPTAQARALREALQAVRAAPRAASRGFSPAGPDTRSCSQEKA